MIHILHEGLPLCGFTDAVPRDWPVGDRWVRREEIETKEDYARIQAVDTVCPLCLVRMADLPEEPPCDPALRRSVWDLLMNDEDVV